MFILLYLKSSSLNYRTRLLAGLSVLIVFFLIILMIIMRLFVFAEFSRYISLNTFFYLNYNRSIADNFYSLKIDETLLQSFRLAGLDRHWLGDELAVICDKYENHTQCGLIIQSPHQQQLEQYLASSTIIYRRLNNDTDIIGNNEPWLKAIKLSHNPFSYWRSQGSAGKF